MKDQIRDPQNEQSGRSVDEGSTQLPGMAQAQSMQANQNLVTISRRRFLQVLGASTAVGAAACASPAKQEILPYVKGDPEQIPGVAVWYSSTCTECSAGCGIRVRTREGRAVKVEGNPHSPVNRGSLCALGQSSLQGLYDPDRIRTPLKRTGSGPSGPTFEPTTWEEVLSKVAQIQSSAKGKKVLLTGELPTAQNRLAQKFIGELGWNHVVWDPLQPVALAKASELVFGTYGIPTYAIDKAEVVVNFGADFLETFVNPVGYARQWSDSRRSSRPLRLVHVEPRLSLTGANADLWLKPTPGSELKVVQLIIRELLQRGRGQSLAGDTRSRLNAISKGITASAVESSTGIPKEKLLLVVEYLAGASASLVLAGGTATSTPDPLPLFTAVNLLNLLLGNVGKTVQVAPVSAAQLQKPASSADAVAKLADEMRDGKVDLVVVNGTNPAFTFPDSFGFRQGLNQVSAPDEKRGKGAGVVVALSSHLDETALLSDYVLPVHHNLEDWGYVQTVGGGVSLIQPAMRPIFASRSFGEILLTVAKDAQKPLAETTAFDAFVKAQYVELTKGAPDAGSERFWLTSLERGGYFPATSEVLPGNGVVPSAAAFTLNFDAASRGLSGVSAKDGELLLYPFPSVKSFDGRAANRPWLQELPDPITQAVWGPWAELHPKTAKRFGVAQGDALLLRTDDGEVQVPVYVTDHVHESIVAVPLGHGHSAYGRYAKTAGEGSVFSLLPKRLAAGAESVPLLGAVVKVVRGRGSGDLVVTQEFSDQMGRDLAQTKVIAAGAAAHGAASGGHGSHGEEHGGHEHPKQMYEQREHPLYQWGLAIDLAACTGCSACVVACYAENNIPVVGKRIVSQGREMSWLRIERYFDSMPTEDGGEELKVSFLPMMCQHCQNAPCEPVCPVYATYHNEEGMNAMIYNRCVGTRYCSNNCSYKVRRFNWFQYEWPELLDWQLNPDVTKRTVGVMEKCTFCVQRIAEAKDIAKDLGRSVEDGEVTPACVQTCPTQAITFGNLKDPNSRVSKVAKDERAYKVLDHHLNTQPSVSYLQDIRHKA